MAEPFLSEIRMMSFVFAPKGWALCNGQLLPINQNQALFSLLGTTFGGDGRVNFALPDLRGRVPIHVGSGHTLGERGGTPAHTVSISEMPSHQHVVPLTPRASSQDGTTASPKDAFFAASGNEQLYSSTPPTAGDHTYPVPYADTNIGGDVDVTTVGGSQAHLNMQPFLTISFCIALQGIFPWQN
jgi:microcystin-dependent protein